MIEWDESYSVGVKRIDIQHKKMLGMIGDLEDSVNLGTSSKLLGNTIKFLVDYIRYHFADEEELMERFNYSELDFQRERHHEFIQKVTSVLQDLKAGKGVDVLHVMQYLIDWNVDHILKNDTKIGLEMREKLSDAERQALSRPRSADLA